MALSLGRRPARTRPPDEKRTPAAARRSQGTPPFAGGKDGALAELIGTFLEDLAAQNYAARTLRTYRKALTRLAPELGRVRSAAELLSELGELAPATRALYLAAVRTFDAWASEVGATRNSLFAHGDVKVRRDPPAPRPLAPEVLHALDGVARRPLPSSNRHHTFARVRLLYWLLRETGLRPEEALPLRWAHIQLEPGREALYVQDATTGKVDRVVVLEPGRLLTILRRRRPLDGATCVFSPVGGKNRPWSYDAALEAWQGFCAVARVKATLHQLRHTYATELARRGLSPHALQRQMGWRKLETASWYVRYVADDVRDELAQTQSRRS